MEKTTQYLTVCIFVGLGIVLAGCMFACPIGAEAQTGNNAVYTSSGSCSPCASSPAFIDASVFAQSGSNICKVLNGILSSASVTYPATGAIIDARGLTSTTPSTSMTCTSANPSPWYGISSPPPSTILLPATTPSAPISIPSTWILPANTHLIGEGDSVSSSTTVSTTIQAQSGFSGIIIQFGLASCLPPLGSASS